jgi:hypothetical protein
MNRYKKKKTFILFIKMIMKHFQSSHREAVIKLNKKDNEKLFDFIYKTIRIKMLLFT